MTDMKKIGRRNRQRGTAFEKRMAKYLNWVWVGKIRHTMQRGDVVDGFMAGGRWFAECKTQQPPNWSVRKQFIRHMYAGVDRLDRLPILILGRYRDRFPIVVLPPESYHVLLSAFIENKDPVPKLHGMETKVRGNGIGFVLQDSWFEDLDRSQHIEVSVSHVAGIFKWYVLYVEEFKRIIDKYDLHVPKIEEGK